MKKIKIAAAAVFIMTVLFVLPVTVKAASVGETVSQSTAEELKAIDYATNETIGKLLAPSYSLSDMLNKKMKLPCGRERVLWTSLMNRLKKN